MTRLQAIRAFYSLLDELINRVGGTRRLAECHGRMDWPQRGVYFFFEPGEQRTDSGTGARVVRIGTHAITSTSKSSLWGALSQHRGTGPRARGNHRGRYFA